MHPEARGYVAKHAGRYPFAVELGARDVNGGVADLFDCDRYIGVDIAPGAGVDVVADAAEWWPDTPADLVVCCEVLEHTAAARRIVDNAAAMLAPGGRLIVTAATDPRPPHSAADGGPPRAGEWYHNVDPDDLGRWMTAAGLSEIEVEAHRGRGDVYATGVKRGRT